MLQERNESSNSGSRIEILGVASGIFAFILALIPNLNYSIFAVFPGILGIILSVISLSRAFKAKSGMNMVITGLVLATVSCAIAIFEFCVMMPLSSYKY
jgi:hypothetical protein